MPNIKLSKTQKNVLRIWQYYPNEICVTLESGYFLTGGHGIDIPKNTYWALKNRGIVGSDDRLTEFGKTLNL